MANLITQVATNEGNQTSRVYDISQSIAVLSTFQPIILNLALADYRPTSDVRFQWDEMDYSTITTLINHSAGYNTTATSLVVDDGTIFTAKDLVHIPRTDEIFQVVSVSTNTLTVLRGLGPTPGTGVAINDNDVLVVVGSAYQEGSTTPDVNMYNTTTVYNYTQIERMSYSETGSHMRTKMTPGMDMATKNRQYAEQFNRALELNLLFGHRTNNTSDFSKVRTTTGGIYERISTNTLPVGGTLSEDVWEQFLVEKAFKYGASEKLFVHGDNFSRCFAKWGRNKLVTQIGMNQLGIQVITYISPAGGTLQCVNHQLFKGNTTYAGLGLVIDPNELALRYTENPLVSNPTGIMYPNGRIQFGEGIQAKGTDGLQNEFFCEVGLEMRNEQKHARISGVTGAST
jgi:hypothetical protein